MRNVFCGVKRDEKMLLYLLPEDNCNYLPPLKHMQECKVKPCHTQWMVSPWKEVYGLQLDAGKTNEKFNYYILQNRH